MIADIVAFAIPARLERARVARWPRLLAAAALALSLAGCGLLPEVQDETAG